MSDFRNDISALIQLKYDLEMAFETNDTDRVSEILEKFKGLYESLTGKSFEEGFTGKNNTKIKSISNIEYSKDNIESEELEEIEM